MCVLSYCMIEVFLFKQKTAYEVRISDWSSDVCSSDLLAAFDLEHLAADLRRQRAAQPDHQRCDVGRIVVVETAVLGLFHHLGEWSFGHAGPLRRREGVDSDAVPSKQIGRASGRERVCQYV